MASSSKHTIRQSVVVCRIIATTFIPCTGTVCMKRGKVDFFPQVQKFRFVQMYRYQARPSRASCETAPSAISRALMMARAVPVALGAAAAAAAAAAMTLSIESMSTTTSRQCQTSMRQAAAFTLFGTAQRCVNDAVNATWS